MHFGPEWMRTKNQSVPRSLQPSPPPATALPQAPSTVATYSALVSVTPVAPEKLDESHPFRYSKEELLAIYQEGGGKGGLGLEVDRWDGVVRELAAEPVTLREMTDAEKKVCCCLNGIVFFCLLCYIAFCRIFEFRDSPTSKPVHGSFLSPQYICLGAS